MPDAAPGRRVRRVDESCPPEDDVRVSGRLALCEDDARAFDDPLVPARGKLVHRDEEDVALTDDPAN
jgi:hypothetical protein